MKTGSDHRRPQLGKSSVLLSPFVTMWQGWSVGTFSLQYILNSKKSKGNKDHTKMYGIEKLVI